MPFWLRGVFCIVVLAVHQAAGQELTESELIGRFLARSPQLRELQAGLTVLREELRGQTFYPNPTAIYTREGAEIWLHGRKRSLGGRRPIDLLADGAYDEVLDAIERLAVGAM